MTNLTEKCCTVNAYKKTWSCGAAVVQKSVSLILGLKFETDLTPASQYFYTFRAAAKKLWYLVAVVSEVD